MTGDFRILPAEPEHIHALPAVELLAASRFDRDSVPERVFTQTLGLDVLERAQAAGHLWVAIVGSGEPVGFIVITVCESVVHIRELDVLPAYGRRGIGAGLIETVEGWALVHGYRAVTLTTFRVVPWNAPYYERLGYHIAQGDELSDDLIRHLELEAAAGFEDRVAMVKRLPAI